MTTKQYINNTENREATIVGLPKPSVETIRTVGMMQLALIASVGFVQSFSLPVLAAIMVTYVLVYPWYGDRGVIEEVLK